MRRLVLVRHGESLFNAEARIQGQQCHGLSDIGHAQAKVTGLALADTYPDAYLVSSDLQRTVETAAPLAAALGREPRLEPAVRERAFGSWEGRLRDEVRTSEPELWRRWLAGEDLVAEIGGESTDDLTVRVEPVLRDLLVRTPDDAVTIVVTHGGPVWHGLHALLDLSRPTLGGVSNASVTEIALRDADSPVMLTRWNDVGHLPLDLRTGWRTPTRASDGPPAGR